MSQRGLANVVEEYRIRIEGAGCDRGSDGGIHEERESR